jgi:hypothetical protein
MEWHWGCNSTGVGAHGSRALVAGYPKMEALSYRGLSQRLEASQLGPAQRDWYLDSSVHPDVGYDGNLFRMAEDDRWDD